MKKVVQLFTVSESVGFIEGLSTYLKNASYQLIIISSDGPEVQKGVAKGEYIHYPVEMIRGISPIQNIKCWFAVRKILKEIRPDIVHGNTPIGGLIAMTTAWSLGVKNRVFTLHGLKYPGEQGFRKVIVKFFEKLTIKFSCKTFAVSKGLMNYAIQERIVDKDKISVLNNGSVKGIDIDYSAAIRRNGRQFYENKFKLNHNVLRIGYFGRINEDKGIPELIEAAKLLLNDYQKLEFLICGAEEMASEQGKISFNNFIQNDKVLYLGLVKEPLKYMICCDCTVLPTHREGFGLVNIEANSVGVPVVTTDVMGCADSIEDGITGFFFPKGNIQKLVEQIKCLLDSTMLAKKMGKAGIKRANALFNRKEIWEALLSAYNELTV